MALIKWLFKMSNFMKSTIPLNTLNKVALFKILSGSVTRYLFFALGHKHRR
jgi:hypothetical protein